MKDLALADRPREKLLRAGASALGDNELVALIVGVGTRQRSALAIAADVLQAAGGAQGLPSVAVDLLRRVSGLGTARAVRVLAAIELGRRALARHADERSPFRTPADIACYLMPLYAGYRLERFGVVLLDGRHRLIRSTILSVGAVDASLAQAREVYREALLASAAAVVVFHNHPSGDPQPSAEDIMVTAELQRAADIVGMGFVDHIILGAGRFYSFREARRLS